MAIEKHTLPNSDTAIWAETANLNYFVTASIEPDTAGEVTNMQVSVPSHLRKPYPGALPGPSICLLYTSPSPRDVEESRMPSSA